ncbi:glyoxalase [candidate division WWE3 bacterium RIFCSPHIGHO2_12_FULL_38_15]|uniref:Glyoxalase n=1 Tax=candidate division WWE3 bacterium RIFCSPHIGHO2_02_FULL_38_14 TaxID=1802620 RepID=A0A1F4V8Y7_UNCKA|nr:MAG: glyoxalase [candidate division WWE3 bacterium RIFCSPHIGHO2_01_FULL_38_45]OGC48347.1 MAG: glyoxalase [candidate division WWE3 bacterium RIFCSPHIGHO2_12_FULL_38_15]OGC53675.1 MAG: glyoxalase [candidate division WWE3 bacterium RIFCSPHIGHO2_02_FULL_38_14]OGC54282.1 MAG: glyoxalase [candidate division WWE3 bacterium RIFCSPLOWO2_01_FULL_37_24]HLB51525.1 VOC family protein [Patescibacteria group bacterium]
MNSITHFELPAKDKERAKKFYTEVFGWKMEDYPEMNYTMVYTSEVDENYMPKKPGAVNGGMMSAKDNGGSFPVLVIDVPNLDEYIKKVEDAGCQIVMPKTEVGDMGYYARFVDPEGVVMGIWESKKKQ